MSSDSFKVKKSLQIKPDPALSLTEAGDLGVDSTNNNRLKYNNGTVTQDVLLAQDALSGGFTQAANVTYDNTVSGLSATNAQAAIDQVEGRVDVNEAAILTKAPLASPAFTGNPTAPTASPGDNDTSIANTAFVTAAIALIPPPVTTASGVSNVPSGNISATNVQAALNELDTEKADASATTTALAGKQPLDSDLTAVAALATNGLIARTGAGTAATRTITGTSNQVTVTNGDGVAGNPTLAIATDPIIPGTGAITVPVGTTAQRPGTPTNGMIRRNSTTSQYEAYDSVSASWGPLGGGAGGINWISPSDASSATGYNVYNDGAVAAPTDGTGGTATVTFTTSSTAPLHGLASYLFTKPASNVQGQGFSKDFTIDSGYLTTPETISMLLKVDSGTYADNDMAWWIYDVTNAVMIQPSAYQIKNSLGVQAIKCEFQPNYNSSSYRLIGHVSSTSALAYVLKIDDISVSPNTYSTGASISDFKDNPNLTYTGLGTIANQVVKTRRVGDSLEVKGFVTPGTPAASLFSIILPPGLLIDTTKMGSSYQQLGTIVRMSTSSQFSTSNYGPFPIFYDGSTNDRIFATGGQVGGANTSFLKGNADYILGSAGNSGTFSFTVPILGWGTSQVLSSDTDTRVVAAYGSSSGASITALNPFSVSSIIKDTHGALSTTGRFTAPVPGYYQATVSVNASTANILFWGYINGVQVSLAGGNNAGGYGTGSFRWYLNAGDIMDIRPATTGTYSLNLDFARLSGPAQIAASETVAASYYVSGATHTPGTNTQINFDTKIFDTHGAVTTGVGAWKFTAPISGIYQLSNFVNFSSGSGGYPRIYKNGSVYSFLNIVNSSLPFGAGTKLVKLLAGDYLDIRPDNGMVLAGGSNLVTSVDIIRVGN